MLLRTPRTTEHQKQRYAKQQDHADVVQCRSRGNDPGPGQKMISIAGFHDAAFRDGVVCPRRRISGVTDLARPRLPV